MTKLIHGDRIGKRGVLRVGASSIIFDESREKVLLTKRTDNGRWCLPGGGVEPGQSLPENLMREVAEETGMIVPIGEWVIRQALAEGKVLFDKLGASGLFPSW